jgi:long-chain acyl-CoA synthetase
MSMNLSHIIEGHADDSLALISRGRPTTYAALRSQVASMRGELTRLGVTKGDVVALLCGNSRYFVVSYLAAVGIGAIVSPLNPTSPAPEIESELNVVKPTAVVIEPSAVPAWLQIPSVTTSAVRIVISTEGHSIDGAHTIDEFLNGVPAPIVEVEATHPAVYMFTSGTAGSPKAAILTHNNLLTNIRQTNIAEHIGPDDVTLGLLPLFHIFGLNVVIGTTLAGGGCVVLVQRFDPVSAMETIAERHVTVVPGAPSMWMALAQLDHPSPNGFKSVRIALSGAAKLPEQIAHSLSARFGLQVYEGYGLTEASPVVTTAIGLEWIPGSIGRPVPGIELRIVDENGGDVLMGDSGEIWIRGENIFAGYLDDAEATARVLTRDGWLRTGDIAVVDDQGHLYMVDRAKDLIIVSGFNVFPAEVEGVLSAHPDIAEVAVVGTDHPHTGEAVRAYVVSRNGVHLDEDAIIDYCRTKLARYKCPSKVIFVDSLPRNISGKVQRFALR